MCVNHWYVATVQQDFNADTVIHENNLSKTEQHLILFSLLQ